MSGKSLAGCVLFVLAACVSDVPPAPKIAQPSGPPILLYIIDLDVLDLMEDVFQSIATLKEDPA